MPRYRVELLDRKEERQLDRIGEPGFGRVSQVLLAPGDDPRPRGCRKLHGLEGRRIRIGPWRVIYRIDDQALCVTIVEVRLRREDTNR